jgi:cytoskeleton protein RodZ
MDGEARRERVSVGSLLRSCRLRAGVTLADAAETLNIRRPYLHAIEEGRYGDLPGPTYALGFVRGYAEYLGLDGNEVTRRFRAETAGTERFGTNEPGTKRPGTKAMLHFPLAASETASPKAGILLVGAMIALVAYGGWYALTAGNGLPPELVAPLPARLAALLPDARIVPETPSPQTLPPMPGRAPVERGAVERAPADPDATKGRQSESSARATAFEGQPALERSATAEGVPSEAVASEADPALASNVLATDLPVTDPAGADPVAAADRPRVILQASEESWVEIRDRFNKRVLSRLMAAGDRLEVPDEAGLRLTVGNAGGIVIKVDGHPVPPIGGPGVVLRNVSLEAARLQQADVGAN